MTHFLTHRQNRTFIFPHVLQVGRSRRSNSIVVVRDGGEKQETALVPAQCSSLCWDQCSAALMLHCTAHVPAQCCTGHSTFLLGRFQSGTSAGHIPAFLSRLLRSNFVHHLCLPRPRFIDIFSSCIPCCNVFSTCTIWYREKNDQQ